MIRRGVATMIRRTVATAIWAYAIWLLLTWTATAEQLVFGALLALAVGVALAPIGDVVAPWRLLDPRRIGSILWLLLVAVVRIVRANAGLAVRIWRPSRPLRSGMVIVPTALRTDGEIGALGLITSLIVDNQIVDVDRTHDVLQYHAVAVPTGSPAEKAESITAPVEGVIRRIDRRQ